MPPLAAEPALIGDSSLSKIAHSDDLRIRNRFDPAWCIPIGSANPSEQFGGPVAAYKRNAPRSGGHLPFHPVRDQRLFLFFGFRVAGPTHRLLGILPELLAFGLTSAATTFPI
jgi:hypothetical protein